MITRVILVGIGGASSSGKSTLAKHLKRILPDSVVIHQDDFVPPQEELPIHPVHQVQDWDAPATAIDWPRFIGFLRQVKANGEIPVDHRSYEDLNQNLDIPVSEAVASHWTQIFLNVREAKKKQNERVIWVLVDGFLMYYRPEVIELLDVSILMRAPEIILKERRQNRQWHSSDGSDPEGTSVWRDPPGYWEQIVWPAYIEGHQDLFANGDVEKGELADGVQGLILLETSNIAMEEAIARCCSLLTDVAEKREPSVSSLTS